MTAPIPPPSPSPHIFHLPDIPVLKGKFGQAQIVSGTGLMVIWGQVVGDLEVPRHSHVNEQVTWIIEGSVDYQVGDGPVTSCGPGTVIHVPPGVLHQSWYRGHCRLVEIFNPPRYDMYPGAATHLHGVR